MTGVFLLILSLVLYCTVKADDITVIDVRRNIPLSDQEPVYRDYFLNAGESSVLRKNMVVKVKRKVSAKESPTKSIGEIDVLVGYLRILQIGNKVTVARLSKLSSRDEEPMLEQIGIMTGDRIDTNGSYFDYSKPKVQNSAAEPGVEKTPEEKPAAGAPEAVQSAQAPLPSETAAPRTPAALPIPEMH